MSRKNANFWRNLRGCAANWSGNTEKCASVGKLKQHTHSSLEQSKEHFEWLWLLTLSPREMLWLLLLLIAATAAGMSGALMARIIGGGNDDQALCAKQSQRLEETPFCTASHVGRNACGAAAHANCAWNNCFAQGNRWRGDGLTLWALGVPATSTSCDFDGESCCGYDGKWLEEAQQ